MPSAFEAAYRAVDGHWRSGPPSAEAAKTVRDARHAACQASGVPHWQGSPFGRAPCCYCAEVSAGAPRCRVTAPSHSGHGPQWDKRWRGGPDCDVAHFPIGCTVVCTLPRFTGIVTAFDVGTGEHTLGLPDGTARRCFLQYHFKQCTVTPGAQPQTCCCAQRAAAAKKKKQSAKGDGNKRAKGGGAAPPPPPPPPPPGAAAPRTRREAAARKAA